MTKNKTEKEVQMELELVMSLIALCYAATALIYNVHEFRKVGVEFRKVGRHLDSLTEDHKRFRKEMAAEHREIVSALRSISAGASKSGRKREPQREV